MTCPHKEEIWERIDAANVAAGVFRDWTVSERDQMEALADELNDELLGLKPASSDESKLREARARDRQLLRDLAQRAKALGWKHLNDLSCPRRLVGKRCKGMRCWCGAIRSGAHWPFRELNDHGATWYCRRNGCEFVLWEPYCTRELHLDELIAVAAQDGIQVRRAESVWNPPGTFGIMFYPTGFPPA